ncbi:MAG: hypothetical protein ACYC1S_12690 [Gemmatimonadaceae bacterium]
MTSPLSYHGNEYALAAASSSTGSESRKSSGPPEALEGVVVEPSAVAQSPLGPLGDVRSLQRAEVGQKGSTSTLTRYIAADGKHRWRLTHARGSTEGAITAALNDVKVSTSHALDVYFGLLRALGDAGFPANGLVRVGRWPFLKSIGWTRDIGSVRTPNSVKLTASQCRAGGRQYLALEHALEALAELAIQSDDVTAFLEDPTEYSVTGHCMFRILQGYALVSSLPDGEPLPDRPASGHRADDLIVQFSAPFMRLLLENQDRVAYRLDTYLALAPGTPRAFYRYLVQLSTRPMKDGSITVDLDEIYGALGSSWRGKPPARARQLLTGVVIDALRERGVLRAAPSYVRERDGAGHRYRVTLRPGTPPTAELAELLYTTLMAYGLTPKSARRFSEGNTEWAATIVAASTLGMLEVKKDLPSMLYNYCVNTGREGELDEPKMPRFRPRRGRRAASVTNASMEYLQESFEGNRLYLEGLHESARAALTSKYAAPTRPAWVTEGLVLAAVRAARAGWSLRSFLQSRGVRLSGSLR